MKIKDKNLESFLLKAEADPKIMEIMRGIMHWTQAAGKADIPIEEVAAVGTVGYQLSKDESLKAFFEYMMTLNSIGIKPTEH
jgi:hypothetical protein